MIKRWYRSRKNQFLFVLLIILLVIYYILLNDTFHSSLDLDITRRYIENELHEAVKAEKGSGCELPILDPFAKEVTQFDRIVDDIVCDGRDWVRCYRSECSVVPDVLIQMKNIECVYKDIVHETDQKYHIGPPNKVLGSNKYVLVESDHVKVSCVGISIESNVPSKWSGHSIGFRKKAEPSKPAKDNALNILIIGFDSTSRNGFIRHMPKSLDTLKNVLKAYNFEGYNILGDGTPAALFPILTGKNELELPEARRSKTRHATLDSFPFIFKRLKEYGYRTLYFEDSPGIGTFQYRFNGFNQQPADHYLRSFLLEESKNKKTNGYCIGDTPLNAILMNKTRQFLNLDGNKYAFTFIADISHDDANMITTADQRFSDFLKGLKEDGTLSNTAVFVMSDHGPRYANVRDTYQGKLEERLPVLWLHIPENKLTNDMKNALKINQHALVTAHDIHATVLDLLELPQLKNNFKVPGSDLPRALSLLEPVPLNRSCAEAGIETHWCACLKWSEVTKTDRLYEKVARKFVDFINELTETERSLCEPRTLDTIQWVQKQVANKKLLAFKDAKDNDGYIGRFNAKTKIETENYQIKVTVKPNKGVYEALAVYVIKDDKFIFRTKDISRVNAYNNEPSCISSTLPHLNPYCFCKNQPENIT